MCADYYYDDPGNYTLSKKIIPGEFEASPGTNFLIAHYIIQIDVQDSQYNLVASRQKEKQITITFNGLTQKSDIEEVADSLIGQTEFLPEEKRDDLLSALLVLQGLAPKKTTQTISSSSSKPSLKSESAPQLAVSLSRSEVNDLLHDALESIHWGDESKCIETLTQLVEIAKFDQNAQLIVQHQALMNTLCNSLKKYASSSIPVCILITRVFVELTRFSNYQKQIQEYKVGAMSLNVLVAQIHITQMASKKMAPDAFAEYLKTQNVLLRLLTQVLFNMCEDPVVLRKVVNNSISDQLNILLKRKDAELVIVALRFLRRITLQPTNWGDVPFEDIVPMIVKNVFRWKPAKGDNQNKHAILVLREGLELLYAFSFNKEVFPCFGESGVVAGLSKLADIRELKSLIIRICYNMSKSEDLKQFNDQNILSAMIQATTKRGEDRTIALIVLTRLSSDPDCSAIISKSPVFTTENLLSMFVQATSTSDEENTILLKLIRNVADNQPKLIIGFENEIINAVIRNANNPETLCDIFAISSREKMNKERAQIFTSNAKFLDLVVKTLGNSRASPQLQLECVMFVGSVALYQKSNAALMETRIVDHIVNIFLSYPDDLDIQTQCLFTFYRFVIHSASRDALTKHSEIIDAVIQHSASKNHILSQMANSVLEALATFDKTWKEKILKPRFIAFNQDWLKEIEAQSKGNSEVSQLLNRLYD